MDDYTYQIQDVEDGTHILIFNNGLFERKVFVPVSEYNPDSVAWVIGSGFRELYVGTHANVISWLKNHSENPKAIAVGKDFQILSISEYISLHG